MSAIKISEEECEKYEHQVLNAMLNVYNKLKDEDLLTIKLNHEMRIIFETLKAGEEEAHRIRKKIEKEAIERGEDPDSKAGFWPSIETYLVSCVAGGILWADDKVPHDTLNPAYIGGDRIRALIKAMRLMEACNLLDEAKDEDFLMWDSQRDYAMETLDRWESK